MNRRIKSIAVNIVDNKSEIGKLSQMPSESSHKGKVYSRGRSMSNCLDNDKIIDFLTMLRLWKKLVAIIWNPTIGKLRVSSLSALSEISSRAGSDVNIPHTTRGRSIPKMKQRVVVSIASLAVFQNTSLTLE